MKRLTQRAVVGFLGGMYIVSAIMPGATYGQALSVGGNPAYPKSDNPRSANIFILELKPGATVKDGIRISNPTKVERTVNLGAVDAVAATDGSFSCRQNSEKKTQVGSWVKLDKKQITLAAGAEETVDFAVTAPQNAGPGEHGGCITFQDTKSYAKTSGSGIQLGFRGAVRMAVTVPGEIRKELNIVRIETKRNEDGSYMVSPLAKNSGNVSLDVQARAQLKGMFGQKSRLLDDAKYPIMPGASMGWPYRFERPYWGGYYKAYTSLSYNADPTAGIGERMGETKRTSKVSSYFFMVPAPGAIAVYAAVILLPLMLIGWVTRKKRTKAKLDKKWVTYIVQPGDSLTTLAEQHAMKWKRLAKINSIHPPYGLTVGQEIKVPRAASTKGRSAKKRRNFADQAAGELVQQEAVPQASEVHTQEAASRSREDRMQVPPRDVKDIPWPSQEEEYRRWQDERNGYYVPTPSNRSSSFANPYHDDEDPAKVAESWNGPSQEAMEQHGIVENVADLPPMHSMWDDLGNEPKKAPKATARSKKTTSKKTTTPRKTKQTRTPKKGT